MNLTKTLYLSGYSTVGKDTLFKSIINRQDERGWLMFSDRDWKINIFNPKRFAFADFLKQTVANKLGIEWNEEGKDTQTIKGKTLRDWCIESAKNIRNTHGDDYFAKKIELDMKRHHGTSIVTDLRFKSELLNHDNCLTIYLYRRDVPIEEYYKLDVVRFDIVLCPTVDDFEHLKTTHPQYTSYQNKGAFNFNVITEETQYLNLVRNVLDCGTMKMDRTGTGTISTFGTSMRYSLRDNTFPLLTTKKMFYRAVVEELLFFLKGQTNSKILDSKGIKIWNINSRDSGELGPVYGFQWRHYGAKYESSTDDYTGQGIDQLVNVINSIKTNPNSRRMIVSAWNPQDIDQMVLPPCHMMFQFHVDNGELSCSMYQRSGDLGLGVPFNIASYSLLTIIIAHMTNLKPGNFIHFIGDTHVYLNHVDPLKKQLDRIPYVFPKLYIKDDVHRDDVSSFTYDDFELRGYKCHPSIKMVMNA